MINQSELNRLNSTMVENNLFISIFSILLIIVMLIGVVGNLLVIYVVLNYGRLKTVTNTYLLHLAFSDLIFLSGIPFFVSSLITHAWIFGSFVCKLFFLTQGVNQYTSIIILALLSFDRYLAVCHSARSIIWRSRVNPNLLLILAWILSFILMIPIITSTTMQPTSTFQVQCTINFPYSEPPVLYFIFVVYTSAITFVLPLSLMIYFYIKIVRRLKHKVSQQHRRSHTATRTRQKVSILVLTVISVHIFCCSPYWALQVLTTTELLSQTSSILVPLSSIGQLLLFVNSSTNPVLYAFLSEIFRSSFKRVFYCCLSDDDNQYLHEKAVAKRNAKLINTKADTDQTNIPMKTISFDETQTNTTNQCLSLETTPMNVRSPNRHNRLSSSARMASIFSSDASVGSDI